MAYSARDVVTLAFRKLGVIRAGGEPRAADAADALASLISQYQEWVSQGTFGRVESINISNDGTNPVTAGLNQHINVTTDDSVTVDLPATVSYDYWWTWQPCRDYGWGKNIPVGADATNNVPRDLSVIVVTRASTNAPATYIYDGSIQRWMRVEGLTMTDEAPLSARGLDGLASVLAVRLIDQFGDSLASAATVQAANRYKMALVTRHGGPDCDGWGW